LINSNGFEDADIPDHYFENYENTYVYGGINQGLVNQTPGHHLDMAFG
jgi:hypothetical protein